MKATHIRWGLVFGALWLAIFLGGEHVLAVTINQGDLVVADRSGKIIHIDRTSGIQTLLASGGHILDSIGIAISLDGDILVADVAALGGSIIRLDPQTGEQTVVSTGGIFVNPVGIAIAANGELFVVDDFGRQVIGVDPVTGQQTLISSGGNFLNPFGIAIDAQGDLIISDVIADSVIRVDSTTGTQTVVSSDGNFVDPFGIAIGPNGDLVVADANASGGPGAVIVVDPLTGAQTILSSGGSFFNPVGVAVDSNGGVFIGDANGAKVIRVDANGSQSVLSAGGLLVDVVGIAIVPAKPMLITRMDSFLRKNRPNANEGASHVLRIQKWGRTRAVVAFDISGLSAAQLTKASLVLTIAETPKRWGKKGHLVEVHRLHDPFEEGNGMLVGRKRGDKTRGHGPGVTWNCPTDAEIGNRRIDCEVKWLGGTISAGPATDVVRHSNGMTGEVTWDVTLDVRDALTDGETEVRWLLRKAKEQRRGKVGYYSKEGAAVANDLSKAPRLLLELGK